MGLDNVWIGCQRGKRCLTLDLGTPEGQEVLRKLIAGADIIHTNRGRGVCKGLGFDYETAKAINPNIIYCHTTASGETGPNAGWLGMDQLGEGQYVHTCILNNGMLYASDAFIAPPGVKTRPPMTKDQTRLGPLYRLYRTQEGWIFIVAANESGNGRRSAAAWGRRPWRRARSWGRWCASSASASRRTTAGGASTAGCGSIRPNA